MNHEPYYRHVIRTLFDKDLCDGDSISLDALIEKLQSAKLEVAKDETCVVSFYLSHYNGDAEPKVQIEATRRRSDEEIAARQAIRDENENLASIKKEESRRKIYESLKAIYESKA